jgi:hypothetical protein
MHTTAHASPLPNYGYYLSIMFSLIFYCHIFLWYFTVSCCTFCESNSIEFFILPALNNYVGAPCLLWNHSTRLADLYPVILIPQYMRGALCTGQGDRGVSCVFNSSLGSYLP